MPPPTRKQITYIALSILAGTCGLLSRSGLIPLPRFIIAYAGDTLWALALFLWVCILFPTWPTRKSAATALAISFTVEFSQLYHAPWIDTLRHTAFFGLILGYGFKPGDLVCYSVGVLSGSIIDRFTI